MNTSTNPSAPAISVPAVPVGDPGPAADVPHPRSAAPGGGAMGGGGRGGSPLGGAAVTTSEDPGALRFLLGWRKHSVNGLILFRGLTDRKVGGPIICALLVGYGVALSTENMMNALGKAAAATGRSARAAKVHFVPKPGLNDGFDASRVLPNFNWVVPVSTALVKGDKLPPINLFDNASGPVIWAMWEFYFALGAAITCQYLQAHATRSRDPKEIADDLRTANSVNVPQVKPGASPLAKIYAKEMEGVGVSAHRGSTIAIAVSYGIEVASAISSLYGTSGSMIAKLVYAALAVGLAEVAQHLSKDYTRELSDKEIRSSGLRG